MGRVRAGFQIRDANLERCSNPLTLADYAGIGDRGWLPGQAGRRGGWGAVLPDGEPWVDRPFGKGRVQGSLGASEFGQGHPSLRGLQKACRCGWMLKARHLIPRPTARHQATPLPAESWVQKAGLARRWTRTFAQRGMSGVSGRPGRRKSPGDHQHLRQSVKSSGSPHCHPFHRRVLTGASSRKPDDCDQADRPDRPEAPDITRCSEPSTGRWC